MPFPISLKGKNPEDKTKSTKILYDIVSGLKFKSIFCWVLYSYPGDFYINLTQAGVIKEEGASIEKMHP